MTHRRRLIAAVTTLAAIAVATVLATTTTSGAVAADAVHRPSHTRVNLHLTGCDSCSVTLQHAVSGHLPVWTSRTKQVGADHEVTFRMRSTLTHGMSFVLRAPWQGDTGAVPNIVTRYRGHHLDSFVGRAGARHATAAEGCWAGTSLSRVDLDFHVARVTTKALDGTPTQLPLAYATHTMSSWKAMVSTYKGTIGNQDAFYCTKPPTTKLTLEAANCGGCEFQVMNGALRPENSWGAPAKTMTSGAVTFWVPQSETRGMSATVSGPWEGHPDFITLVAWRYPGHRAGDPVGFRDARGQTRGTACWAGGRSHQVVVPLTVRKVMVGAYDGPTAGTIAYAKISQRGGRPMSDAHNGVIGAQEPMICRR
jgi:hypothetical protein